MPNEQIKEIEIYKSPVKLKAPFIISLGSYYHAENIVIVIRTKHKIIGFGECSPFFSINGENMHTAAVAAKFLAKALIGKNALDLENCTYLMDEVMYGNSSIKSAFDMALYDIASQYADKPLYEYLGGTNDKRLFTDYTVSIGDPSKMASDAVKIKENGFQAIKVKLGRTFEKDVESIKKIREAVGTKIPLRIDANQAWDVELAIRILKALQPYNVESCEEPIPRWDFMNLSKVREQSPIPIMADESCGDHHDAKRLIDLKACDTINIKLGKSSGIFKALKIIELAEKHNIMLQVGGFLESRLGFTASAHLALASKNIIYFDFDTPLMFTEDPVSGGISYDKKGNITIPEVSGLGASFDEYYLQKLEHQLIN